MNTPNTTAAVTSTLVKIEGVDDITLQIALKSKAEVVNYYGGTYPEIESMNYSYAVVDGVAAHTFKQVDGTKN